MLLNFFNAEAKGGLKFEVVLSQAAVPTPPRSLSPTLLGARPPLSVDKIQQKLEQAAERRHVCILFICKIILYVI